MYVLCDALRSVCILRIVLQHVWKKKKAHLKIG